MYEDGLDGKPRVTGLRVGPAGRDRVVTADCYVAALDVPGAQQLMPKPWRQYPQFDNIYKLVGVPVITVQLRYNGWVTELQDPSKVGARVHIGAGLQSARRSGVEVDEHGVQLQSSMEPHYRVVEGALPWAIELQYTTHHCLHCLLIAADSGNCCICIVNCRSLHVP